MEYILPFYGRINKTRLWSNHFSEELFEENSFPVIVEIKF